MDKNRITIDNVTLVIEVFSALTFPLSKVLVEIKSFTFLYIML